MGQEVSVSYQAVKSKVYKLIDAMVEDMKNQGDVQESMKRWWRPAAAVLSRTSAADKRSVHSSRSYWTPGGDSLNETKHSDRANRLA